MSAVELRSEVVPIAELHPHPRNYHSHPPDQIEHLAQSLREHGQYRNIVVARDGTILAGHGVVEAAASIGMTEVEVVRLDVAPDDPAAIKVLVGDNELGRLASVDDRLLTDHLRGLAEQQQLLGTGYDEKMLAALVFVTRPAHEIGAMDEAAHWAGLPGFEPSSEDILLVVHFDDEAGRQRLIDLIEVGISKKTRQTWSAWWPPRSKNDLASLQFDG